MKYFFKSLIFIGFLFSLFHSHDLVGQNANSDLRASEDWKPVKADWYYLGFQSLGNPFERYTVSLKYSTDTIIQGRNCSKILRNETFYCYYNPKEYFLTQMDNKVYFYYPRLDTFQMLYDYKSNTGDS